MGRTSESRVGRFGDYAVLASLAAAKLLIHFLYNGGYGYQRDELYFIACGEHLDWGYVDIGPLVPWIGRLSREVLGESLFALRFFPAVAGAATVFLTGLLAREMGGKRFAQATAAVTVIVAPMWLQGQNILALPSFEPLFWVACAWLIARIVNTGDPRLWLWVGAVSGVGILNKPSMLFFGVALVVGVLLTPERKQFKSPWLYAGGMVAFLVALPFTIWQVAHDWPTWQFVTGLNATLMARITFPEFAIGQIFYIGPYNAPVWIAGLVFLFSKAGRPYRLFGIVYVVLFVFMAVAKSKIYYLAPAYPALLAAGACAIEGFSARRGLPWLRIAVPAALVAGGVAIAPIALPILPIERLDRAVKAATLGTLENAYELTGTFHDMFGWENLVATMARAYHALPAEDRRDCVVFGADFGIAGAIDFYGPAYGLPGAVSSHQNYYFWGPGEKPGLVMLAAGPDLEDLQQFYGEVTVVDEAVCPPCVPGAQREPIYVCRDPRGTLQAVWPALRAEAFRND